MPFLALGRGWDLRFVLGLQGWSLSLWGFRALELLQAFGFDFRAPGGVGVGFGVFLCGVEELQGRRAESFRLQSFGVEASNPEPRHHAVSQN